MSEVYITPCDSYDTAEVADAVDGIFQALGGIGRFVRPGERILLKPNLLMPKQPSAATTTHPAIVAAVARAVIAAGGTAVIADSPGGPYNRAVLRALYKVCGMERAAQESGAELNYNTSVREAAYPGGVTAKSFSVIEPFFACDKVINLAKIKTHGMTYYTGGVKNLFGLIGGLSKAEYHMRYKNKEDFCSALVDLCEFAKPALTILDGVVGMEGNGPSNGSPRALGVLVAGENPHLCDLAATAIIGAKPDDVWTLRHAITRGLCPQTLEGCAAGEPVERFAVDDFRFPDTKSVTFDDSLPKFIRRLANRLLLPFPQFDAQRCVRCMRCASVCPAGAISATWETDGAEELPRTQEQEGAQNQNTQEAMPLRVGEKDKRKGLPRLDKRNCIQCYCCQELCPHDAILLQKRRVTKW